MSRLETYKYKNDRGALEASWNKWLEGKDFNSLLGNFFGLRGTEVERVSEDEKAKIKLYFNHVYKRIANAYIEQNRNSDWFLTPEYAGVNDDKEADALHFDRVLQSFFSTIIMHDISHTVEIVADGGKDANSKNSIVPPFFRAHGRELIANRDLIEREAFAGIFQRLQFLDSPLPLQMLDQYGIRRVYNAYDSVWHTFRSDTEIKQFLSNEVLPAFQRFEFSATYSKSKFINAYLHFMLGIPVLVENLNAMNEEAKSKNPNTKDEDAGQLFLENVRNTEDVKRSLNAIRDVIKNPPQIVIDSLGYIYDNRDNPRVLVDLFFKLTEDYYKKLDAKYAVKK